MATMQLFRSATAWKPFVAPPTSTPATVGFLMSFFPMPMVVSGDLAAVSAQTHAAPVSSMILGRVIKKEHALWILALLDQGEVASDQEIARCLGEEPQHLIPILTSALKLPLEDSVAPADLRKAEAVAQQVVDRVERRLWNRLAFSKASGHIPHGRAKFLCLLQRLAPMAYPCPLDPLGGVLSEATSLNQPGDQIPKGL